jgi:calpain-7
MVLDRADKLKRAIESRGGAVGKIAAEDQSRSMEIRRQGSVVNGVHLADWDERGLNRRLPNEWLDPHPPTLSHAQMEFSPVWKRLQWSTRTGKEKELDIDSCLEVEQGPGADCSVVAALAVCLGHHRRHKSFVSILNNAELSDS